MPKEVLVTFHGGLGDIGRNCATVETKDAMLVLDCGVLFPTEKHPGVEFFLPDLSYIRERAHKLVGCIVTHGHEDHTGALSHLLRIKPTQLYGSDFTLGLARRRIKEAKLESRAEFVPVKDNESRNIGPFKCEFLPVTHSVPGGLISAIGTPQGVILHSSDLKLDMSPLDGRQTDLPRIEALAKDPGIRLLLADSTNADIPGSTVSETAIGPELEEIFLAHPKKRLVVACFSSHLHRVQQVIDIAVRHGRKVATLGLSMRKNVTLGRDLGLISVPPDSLVPIEEASELRPWEVCVISTGSQAEEKASLTTASYGANRWIELGVEDVVVISSTPIPGNEVAVYAMINRMMKLGVEVVHERYLHTSGHGKQDELKVLHKTATPEWFVPVHGEYRHLLAHAELAERTGMSSDRVLVAKDGDQIVLTKQGLNLKREVTRGDYLMVQGTTVGVDRGVLKERRRLGSQGVVVITVAELNLITVQSWGWLDEPEKTEMEALVGEAVKLRLAEIKEVEQIPSDELRQAELRKTIYHAAKKAIKSLTGRWPMIIAVPC